MDRKEYYAQYYRRNKTKMDDRSKRWQKNNRDKTKLYQLKTRYKLTKDDLANLGTACHICGEQAQKICVDHCHRSGKIRGLLCNNCNVALGLFKDSPDLLLQAAKYLYVGEKLESRNE